MLYYLETMDNSITIDTFTNLEERWQELLKSCTVNHIFLTPQWQRAWWQVFGSGHKLLLLSLRDASGLVGIAPLQKQNEKLSFIGGSDVCDYMDFIVHQGKEVLVFSNLLDYLESLEWEIIELESLLPQSLTLNFFVPLAREKGYQVEIKQMDISPQLILPSSWEGYFTLLKAKDRHELRRKLRRLERTKAVHSYTIIEKEQLPETLESFFELFKMSDIEKANFMTDQRKEVFNTMVSSLAEKGYVRLSFLEVGGIRTSAILFFDYENDIYLYNSAFNPAYASLSVSLLLKAFRIKDAIENRRKRYDFLRGNEAYKYDLGAQDVPIYRCVITRS